MSCQRALACGFAALTLLSMHADAAPDAYRDLVDINHGVAGAIAHGAISDSNEDRLHDSTDVQLLISSFLTAARVGPNGPERPRLAHQNTMMTCDRKT